MAGSAHSPIPNQAEEHNTWCVIPLPADTPSDVTVHLLRQFARGTAARVVSETDGTLTLEVFLKDKSDSGRVDALVRQAIADAHIAQTVREESAPDITKLVDALITRATGS